MYDHRTIGGDCSGETPRRAIRRSWLAQAPRVGKLRPLPDTGLTNRRALGILYQ